MVALHAAERGDGLVLLAEKTESAAQSSAPTDHATETADLTTHLPSRGSSREISWLLGLLKAERSSSNVLTTDRPELRRLLTSDARENGERMDDEAGPDDDVAGDAAILELALAVLMCFSPRDLKRAKADPAEEREELAVDMELRPCASMPPSPVFLSCSLS